MKKVILAAFPLFLLPLAAFSSAVSYSTLGVQIAENFDTDEEGGWAFGSATWNNSVTFTGWQALLYHGGNDTYTVPSVYVANNGGQSSASDDLYIFRTVGTGDGSLGTQLRDGTTGAPSEGGGMFFGVEIRNDTGAPLTAFNAAYTGEQWWVRSGGQNRFDVSFSTDATSLNSGAWTAIPDLQFLAPNSAATTGAIDGNAPENRVVFDSDTITLASALQPGDSLWLRWFSPNVNGADQSISVDDFHFTAIPEPSTYALIFGLTILGAAAFRRFRR